MYYDCTTVLFTANSRFISKYWKLYCHCCGSSSTTSNRPQVRKYQMFMTLLVFSAACLLAENSLVIFIAAWTEIKSKPRRLDRLTPESICWSSKSLLLTSHTRTFLFLTKIKSGEREGFRDDQIWASALWILWLSNGQTSLLAGFVGS